MKIGIVSDSHGKADRLQHAIDIFTSHNVDAIVHCGDIGSTDCVRALGSTGKPAYAVPGNTDHHAELLERQANACGVVFSWKTVEVPLGDGAYLVATHGHGDHHLDELIAGGQFPYVCHVHTHRIRDERIGKTRVINPGALHHNRDPHHPTAAILDTDTDTLQYFDIPRH